MMITTQGPYRLEFRLSDDPRWLAFEERSPMLEFIGWDEKHHLFSFIFSGRRCPDFLGEGAMLRLVEPYYARMILCAAWRRNIYGGWDTVWHHKPDRGYTFIRQG